MQNGRFRFKIALPLKNRRNLMTIHELDRQGGNSWETIEWEFTKTACLRHPSDAMINLPRKHCVLLVQCLL